MKIGILQTGRSPDELVEDLGDYDALFRSLLDGHGFEFRTFHVLDSEFPSSVDECDGWLITGSRYGAYEDHPWIAPLEQLIRDLYAARKPLIGVCFGHQIIAQALGGKVEKFDGGWAVGRTDYDADGKKVTLNAWHQDQVTQLPKDAKVLGSNPFCDYAILAYGDSIWTVQPHPEFSGKFIDGLIRTRGPGRVPAPQLEAAKSDLDAPVDNAAIARHMAEFLKKERA